MWLLACCTKRAAYDSYLHWFGWPIHSPRLCCGRLLYITHKEEAFSPKELLPVMKMEGIEFSPLRAELESLSAVKKKKMNNKRRFSDEQVRSLESMFEEETKLEPLRKLQVARELGLQPRQVAIWFQNRRARWKSKQLEGEYSKLKASYDALASSFESLKKEKQCLLKQLQKLSDLLKNHPNETRWHEQNSDGNSNFADSDSGEARLGTFGNKPQSSMEDRSELGVTMYTKSANSNSFDEGHGLEELTPVTTAEPEDGSLLIGEWCDFDSGCFSDQSCSSLEWWELWP